MKTLSQQIVLATGARRNALAFGAGATGALAMPPYGLFPLLIVTMAVAVFLLDGCGARSGQGLSDNWRVYRSAAAAGWWLGFGYFLAGLYWLGAAFLVEADRFAWALPLGVIGLPAILALFTAFGFMIALFLWRPGAKRVFALAFGLGLSELLRGSLFTGFPWNIFGMALGQHLLFAQTASFYGLYGLTAVTIALAASPALLADSPQQGIQSRQSSFLLGALGVFAVMTLFGALRLNQISPGTVPKVKLRIMQPNIALNAKFKPAAGMEILRQYLELSDRSTSPTTAGLADVTHLIWPESAFPFVLGREPQALAAISAALAGRTTLITGAIRLEGTTSSNTRAYNALQVIDSLGRITESYDKVHLVPFGEYLPLSGLLRALGLRQFITTPGGFEAGARQRLAGAPGLPRFLPLICYEAIFPYEAMAIPTAAGDAERPGFLLNLTDDAWFGITAGPYQHAAQARLRAIEQGVPMVRAANTGISGVIDPFGRIVRDLPLGVSGVIDAELPKPLPPTLFAQSPVGSVIVVFGFLLIASLFGRKHSIQARYFSI